MCVTCVSQFEFLAANGAVAAGALSAAIPRLRARRDPAASAARASVRRAQEIAFYTSMGLDELGRPPKPDSADTSPDDARSTIQTL